MSGDVIPLRRVLKCSNCGALGRIVDVTLSGESTGIIQACDDCLAATERILGAVRPVFDVMREIGVPLDIRNETLTYLLERWKVKVTPP